MDSSEERRFEGLSPFELKNALVALAKHRNERLWLNAGRGNPNWLALEPRAAFFRLGEFALGEAQRAAFGADLGGLPSKRCIFSRLQSFLVQQRPQSLGDALLLDGVAYATERHGFDPDLLVGEWVDGVLGDHYPVPVRMLTHAEALVREHLVAELFGGDRAAGRFELFAVEGVSAGVAYVFATLVQARLLVRGDRIAIGVPIFTPYLDIPRLAEYDFDVIEVRQRERGEWRYPPVELDKLRDPRVRAFLVVNPSNPTATALDEAALTQLGEIARERPELIFITDDVYAPFVEGFRSIAAVAPRNSIVLYSFSKFWGATGLRLGVVGLHETSVLDERLAAQDDEARRAARARYARISPAPERLKIIERMVAESRAVGLNHTAGLSTPQQIQMTLLALDSLLDRAKARKTLARSMMRTRFERLYAGVGLAPPSDSLLTHYYATIDIPALARSRYGPAFVEWLVERFEPIDFVVRLAEERGIVLLDGGGFDAPSMSVRVSLANLPQESYEAVGRGISELLADYYARWKCERPLSQRGPPP
jgi:aspartate 4-decarboxylase